MADDSEARAHLVAALKLAVLDRADAKPVRGGISFSAPLLQAVLAGRKTQTRRPIRPVPASVHNGVPLDADSGEIAPSVRPGERLWVREKWARLADDRYAYAADGPGPPGVRWISSRFMPKDAARTYLDVIDVRVERLSQIDDAAALAEGAAVDPPATMFGPRAWFVATWDAIYGETEFASARDPWVWVITFRRA